MDKAALEHQCEQVGYIHFEMLVWSGLVPENFGKNSKINKVDNVSVRIWVFW